MTSNPTKDEQIPSYGFRGVEFTKSHGRKETITIGGKQREITKQETNRTDIG